MSVNVVKNAVREEHTRFQRRVKQSSKGKAVARLLGTLILSDSPCKCEPAPSKYQSKQIQSFSYTRPRMYNNNTEVSPNNPDSLKKPTYNFKEVNRITIIEKKEEETPCAKSDLFGTKSKIYSTPINFMMDFMMPRTPEKIELKEASPDEEVKSAWTEESTAEDPKDKTRLDQSVVDETLGQKDKAPKTVKKRKKRGCSGMTGAAITNQWNWMTEQHKTFLLQAQKNLSHLRSIGAPAFRLEEYVSMIDHFVRSKGEQLSLYQTLI